MRSPLYFFSENKKRLLKDYTAAIVIQNIAALISAPFYWRFFLSYFYFLEFLARVLLGIIVLSVITYLIMSVHILMATLLDFTQELFMAAGNFIKKCILKLNFEQKKTIVEEALTVYKRIAGLDNSNNSLRKLDMENFAILYKVFDFNLGGEAVQCPISFDNLDPNDSNTKISYITEKNANNKYHTYFFKTDALLEWTQIEFTNPVTRNPINEIYEYSHKAIISNELLASAKTLLENYKGENEIRISLKCAA